MLNFVSVQHSIIPEWVGGDFSSWGDFADGKPWCFHLCGYRSSHSLLNRSKGDDTWVCAADHAVSFCFSHSQWPLPLATVGSSLIILCWACHLMPYNGACHIAPPTHLHNIHSTFTLQPRSSAWASTILDRSFFLSYVSSMASSQWTVSSTMKTY